MYPYESIAIGKWILLGEHSVIRDRPALVFPLQSKKLRMTFSADFDSEPAPSLLTQAINKAFQGAEKYFAEQGRVFAFPEGNFRVQSSIPPAAGLGSSAALCAALGKIMLKEGVIHCAELWDFCTKMEDEFHGKSSGMDLAVVLGGEPILFQKSRKPQPLTISWMPQIYLMDSGLRSTTTSSVRQVEALKSSDPARLDTIDMKMTHSVVLAMEALKTEEEIGRPALAKAIQLGAECFYDWDLVPQNMAAAMELLRREGALAVKPTGSGNGGYLLSLWDSPPPPELPLVSAFTLMSGK